MTLAHNASSEQAGKTGGKVKANPYALQWLVICIDETALPSNQQFDVYGKLAI